MLLTEIADVLYEDRVFRAYAEQHDGEDCVAVCTTDEDPETDDAGPAVVMNGERVDKLIRHLTAWRLKHPG